MAGRKDTVSQDFALRGETSSKAGEVPLPDAFPRKGLACGRSGIFSALQLRGETSFKAGEVPLPDAFPRKGLACGRSGIFSALQLRGETSFKVGEVPLPLLRNYHIS
ncbi:MAG: hypothetical protein KBS38_02775 [Bacteroidales bacterium]|nr:hypothetical protein [Candidatus Cacconaster caballi]